MLHVIVVAILIPLVCSWGFACYHSDRAAMERIIIARADTRYAASNRYIVEDQLLQIVREYFENEQWKRMFEYIDMLDEYAPWQCPQDNTPSPEGSICYDLQ